MLFASKYNYGVVKHTCGPTAAINCNDTLYYTKQVNTVPKATPTAQICNDSAYCSKHIITASSARINCNDNANSTKHVQTTPTATPRVEDMSSHCLQKPQCNLFHYFLFSDLLLLIYIFAILFASSNIIATT